MSKELAMRIFGAECFDSANARVQTQLVDVAAGIDRWSKAFDRFMQSDEPEAHAIVAGVSNISVGDIATARARFVWRRIRDLPGSEELTVSDTRKLLENYDRE